MCKKCLLTIGSLFYLFFNNVCANTLFTTGPYQNNQHLVETLSIPSAKALVITVVGATESYDLLTLYDEKGNRIARLSGPIYKNFLLAGNTILAEFMSDSSFTADGVTVTIAESPILPPRWQTFQFDYPFYGVTHIPERQRFYVVQGTNVVLELTEDTLATVATYTITGATSLKSIVYLNEALWLRDDSNILYKFDLQSAAIQSFTISSYSRGLTTDGTFLYVINDDQSGIINIIDPTTISIAGIITTPIRNPRSVTILPEGGDLLILDSNLDVYRVEKTTGNTQYYLSVLSNGDPPENISYIQAYHVDMIVISHGERQRISFGLFSEIALEVTQSHFFTYKDYYIVEGQQTAYLDLIRSGFDVSYPTTVEVELTADTAIGGTSPLNDPADFDDTPQIGYFPENSATGAVQVFVNDDHVDEEDESFTLTLLDALGNPQTATVHIIDDDTASIFILPTSIFTPESTNNAATFAVTLMTQPSSEVNVQINREIADQHTVLTFTPTNWNVPQTIAITGMRTDFDWVKFGEVDRLFNFNEQGYGSESNALDADQFSFVSPVVPDGVVPQAVISKLISYPDTKLPRMPITTLWDVPVIPTIQIETMDTNYRKIAQARRVQPQREEFIDPETTFTGIISIGGIDYVGRLDIKSVDYYSGSFQVGDTSFFFNDYDHYTYSFPRPMITVTINIKPATADLGKKADLLFIMGLESEFPFNRGIDTTYFSVGQGHLENQLNLLATSEVWLAQLSKSLADPFIKEVTLESTMTVRTQFLLRENMMGYHILMGYRLEDGTLVYQTQPLTVTLRGL